MVDRGGRQPMCHLHLLRLFTNHDEQNDAQEHARQDEHAAVGQLSMQDKGDYSYETREEQPQERADENRMSAEPKSVALQKQHNFEAFAVNRAEAEQSQSPDDSRLGSRRVIGGFKKVVFPLIVG